MFAAKLSISRRSGHFTVAAVLSALALALPGQVTPADAATAVTIRVSYSGTGLQANARSDRAAITPDGRYVAFSSAASNLVPGDTNRSTDVFVRDRQTRSTSRASYSSTRAQSNQGAFDPAISADGRYVAFTSAATNLVPGDTNSQLPDGTCCNGGSDVFVRDRQAGTTRRISVSNTGAQSSQNSDSGDSAISADGRYITFGSNATNLVAGDTNAALDVFVRDVQAGTTRRISLSSTGAQANGTSTSGAISADGRYVTFESAATNLVPNDTNGVSDVFRRDVQAGTTRRVSVSNTGAQANNAGPEPGINGSRNSAISADGRYVAFESLASNLVAGDTNWEADIFLRDVLAGTTRRMSVSGTGVQANSINAFPAISPDGRYVGWHSVATNLVPRDTNATSDIFVRDWQAGTTRRASYSGTGVQGNSGSHFAALSAGGTSVAFDSFASNLVPTDTNGVPDIFVRVT